MSIYDEDTVGSDDHVDDVYVEERIDPGETIAEVSDVAIISWYAIKMMLSSVHVGNIA